jgi:hypothetical protein
MWHSKTGTCPKCREKFDKTSLRTQWAIAKVIDNSIAKCGFCSWSGPFVNYNQHIIVDCKEVMLKCPLGCNTELKRGALEEHYKTCTCRYIECDFCKVKVPAKLSQSHEGVCMKRTVMCSNNCGKKISAKDINYHLEEECDLRTKKCRFAKVTDCQFTGTNEKLEEHYTKCSETHFQSLLGTIYKLKDKIEKFEKSAKAYSTLSSFSSSMEASFGDLVEFKPLTVTWSTGTKRVSGSASKSWSFVLSSTAVKGPFKARIKVTGLNFQDSNGWKICIGVFNST